MQKIHNDGPFMITKEPSPDFKNNLDEQFVNSFSDAEIQQILERRVVPQINYSQIREQLDTQRSLPTNYKNMPGVLGEK